MAEIVYGGFGNRQFGVEDSDYPNGLDPNGFDLFDIDEWDRVAVAILPSFASVDGALLGYNSAGVDAASVPGFNYKDFEGRLLQEFQSDIDNLKKITQVHIDDAIKRRTIPEDRGVNPLADQHFPRLLSVFPASSFRLYARKTKMALTNALGLGAREKPVPGRSSPALGVVGWHPPYGLLAHLACITLTIACAAGAQADERAGKLIGDDLSSAIVEMGGLFEARPDTVRISGCDVRIEYVYANSCKISSKIANEIVEFRLNEVSNVYISEGSIRTILYFSYTQEVAEFASDASKIVRAMRNKNAARHADDPHLALQITERLETFFAENSISLRSTITYCNGASVPSFYPTTDAHVFIDTTRAAGLAERLNDYIEAYCPMDQEG